MFIFLICIVVSTSLAIHCPFHYWHKPCLRTQEFLELADQYEELKNPRPDIDISDATEDEKKSERACCYERRCLIDCDAFDQTYSNFVKQNLHSVDKLVEEYPRFWKVIDQGEIDALKNRTASGKLKNLWRIKISHFEIEKKKLEAAQRKVQKLEKFFH